MNVIAKALLESKSVHIEPVEENFFTWTSGKRSPIYCNNRQLISFPHFRVQIISQFIKVIKEKYSDVELIAGTATAGIPWAAWIAHELNLPMVYIRSKAKGHGLKSAIEGSFYEGEKTLIIEDLISTGKSAIEALNHCKQEKLNTMAVLAIFTYGFNEGDKNFKKAQISYESLCDLSQLLQYAREQDQLSESDVSTVENWRADF